ncbi:MAG: DUF1499 domain-containing protein [Planctomycetes bacterium]|nr:DUF1499 domain-containing protein [Planctomycetota bacterium]
MPSRPAKVVAVAGVLLALGVSGVACVGCSAPRPTTLGVHAGRLNDCPGSPNCVASQTTRDDEHFVEPLTFSGDARLAWQAAVAAAKELPGASVVEERADYLWIECTSRFFRFVDDLELQLVDDARRIDLRSASRLGYSDLGVNRARIESLRSAFEARLRAE